MANARTNAETTAAVANNTLSNPMDNLVDDAKRIAKFLSDSTSEVLIRIILDALDEYDRPLRRFFRSRRKEIESQLRQLGYDPDATNSYANLKSIKEILKTLTASEGKDENSFNTILALAFVKVIPGVDPDIKLLGIQCYRLLQLTIIAMETRQQYQAQIDEQEIQLKHTQEIRLREEESLLKTQLESSKCRTLLSELLQEKSGTSAELKEMEEEKRAREARLLEYQAKLQSIAMEELEKLDRLEKIKQEEGKKKEELEAIKDQLEVTRKRFACLHADFDPGDLTLEQLERAKDTAEKAFLIHVASEHGKVKKDDELVQMNAKKVRAKAMQEKISEGFVDEEAEKVRASRQEELTKLFGKVDLSEEEKEQAKLKKENFKEQLNLCLRLGQNKAEQKQVEEDKREISLQKDGFYTTVHETSSISLPQENYSKDHESDETSQEHPRRKLEKKPLPKSFKEMKMKQGMSSGNKGVNKAFAKLNFFFGGKKPDGESVAEEQKQSTPTFQ